MGRYQHQDPFAAFAWNVSRLPVGFAGWSSRIASLSIAVGLAVLCGRMAWGYGYQNPFLEETLLIPAQSNGLVDTFYHSATSSMLRPYGVASTGIDGIPWTVAPARLAARIASARFFDRIPVNARWTPLSDRSAPVFRDAGGRPPSGRLRGP